MTSLYPNQVLKSCHSYLHSLQLQACHMKLRVGGGLWGVSLQESHHPLLPLRQRQQPAASTPNKGAVGGDVSVLLSHLFHTWAEIWPSLGWLTLMKFLSIFFISILMFAHGCRVGRLRVPFESGFKAYAKSLSRIFRYLRHKAAPACL